MDGAPPVASQNQTMSSTQKRPRALDAEHQHVRQRHIPIDLGHPEEAAQTTLPVGGLGIPVPPAGQAFLHDASNVQPHVPLPTQTTATRRTGLSPLAKCIETTNDPKRH